MYKNDIFSTIVVFGFLNDSYITQIGEGRFLYFLSFVPYLFSGSEAPPFYCALIFFIYFAIFWYIRIWKIASFPNLCTKNFEHLMLILYLEKKSLVVLFWETKLFSFFCKISMFSARKECELFRSWNQKIPAPHLDLITWKEDFGGTSSSDKTFLIFVAIYKL